MTRPPLSPTVCRTNYKRKKKCSLNYNLQSLISEAFKFFFIYIYALVSCLSCELLESEVSEDQTISDAQALYSLAFTNQTVLIPLRPDFRRIAGMLEHKSAIS